MNRREYLDWLRGLAVLIMIEAHTLDAWTRISDRTSTYGWAMVLAGYGAPFFMFLAGIGMALAAAARLRKGQTPERVAAVALQRGIQIFAFAFLFRAQAWLISGGSPRSLLKVDILNVMGLSMIVAALIWRWTRRPATRALCLAALAVACTMVTPLVRATPLLDGWPQALSSYLRPIPGRTTFTLFPWAGFLLAGAAAGIWLSRTANTKERSVTLLLGGLGVAMAVGGYLASYLPSLYPKSEFWTSSPTYFFVRLGILFASLPLAFAWCAAVPGWSPLQVLGRSSLFVYWIHVELVYGGISQGLHRALSFGGALVGFVLFTVLMFLVTLAKVRVVRRWNGEGAGAGPELSPVGSRV